MFGTQDFNTLDLPLPKAGHAKLGLKGIQQEEGVYGGFALAYEKGLVNVRSRLSQPQFLWTAREFFADSQVNVTKVMNDYYYSIAIGAINKKKMRLDGEKGDHGDGETFLDHLAESTDGTPCTHRTHMRLTPSCRKMLN